MRSKRRNNGQIMPNGETVRERWYALARRYCGIIADRKQENELCRTCFKMRMRKRDLRNIPVHGCLGCVEMDNFFEEAAALIMGEASNPKYQRLC